LEIFLSIFVVFMKVLKFCIFLWWLINFPQVKFFVWRKIVGIKFCMACIQHMLFGAFFALKSLLTY
jgi:hypothetical protein